MCLIAIKEKGYQIPTDDLTNAVLNNPDGWGYIVPDRGELEIRRFYENKDTDPDDVLRFMEDNIDNKVYLHLRFATAGAKSKDNIHPFPVLQKRKHGCQIMAMHNGTYSAYKPSGNDNRSDTQIFCEKVLTPLLERFGKNCSKKTLLQDPIVQQVLDKFNEGWSRLVLVDQWGNDLRLGDSENEQEGLWFSNDYSFKTNYRTPSTSTTSYVMGNQKYDNGWKVTQEADGSYTYRKYDSDTQQTRVRYGTTPYVPYYIKNSSQTNLDYTKIGEKKEDKELKDHFLALEYKSTESSSASNPPSPSTRHTETGMALTFLDQYGLNSFEEMFCLSKDDLTELCEDNPELMADCIIGLLNILYTGKEV